MTADFHPLGGGRYCVKAAPLSLDVDRLRWGSNGCIGELTVRAFPLDVPEGIVVSCSDFNLSSQRARQDRAKFVEGRGHTNGFDVYALVEILCQKVLEAERQGQPAVCLPDVPLPTADAEMDADGFRLLRQHPMILFGDGGTAKSYLALYWGGLLVQRGLRVLFADWELTAEDHKVRLARLFGADQPRVQYVRCDRPLIHEADRLRRLCRADQIDYLIIDSVAVACAGPAEASEVAAEVFRALRQIEVGSLDLAHITKGDHGDLKPFGSAFWSNLARSTWNIKQTANDSDRLTVGLFHRKANLTGLQPALGYELHFGPERTVVRRVSVADTPELADSLPLKDRMRHAVRLQPMTAAALADELGAKVETVERKVRAYPKLFARVLGSNGITRIALAERRPL